MLAKIQSSAVVGVDGLPVEVEVDISYGLPAFSTVGCTFSEPLGQISLKIKRHFPEALLV